MADTGKTQPEGEVAFAEELAVVADSFAESMQAPVAGSPSREPQPAAAVVNGGRNGDLVMRIPVSVKVILGSAVMQISELSSLAKGALIPLDRKIGEAVDIVVNGQVVARGEVVLADERSARFAVTITEVAGLSDTGRNSDGG